MGRHLEPEAGLGHDPFVEEADHFFPKTIIPSKVNRMPNIDVYEREILAAFDKGSLKSVATKAELEKFRAAARASVLHKYVSGRLVQKVEVSASRPAQTRKRG